MEINNDEIELIIKIPKSHKRMVDAIVTLPPQVENDLISAIRHGTPVPKDHSILAEDDNKISENAGE